MDAVVHLANIPAPGLRTPALTLSANTTMNSNVFLAAATLGLQRVVWASSETTLGLPFDVPPRYAPVDEEHYPYPTSTYALSKVVSETMAEHIAEWSGIPFVALRFSNISVPSGTHGCRTPLGQTRRREGGTSGVMWTCVTWRAPAGPPWRLR